MSDSSQEALPLRECVMSFFVPFYNRSLNPNSPLPRSNEGYLHADQRKMRLILLGGIADGPAIPSPKSISRITVRIALRERQGNRLDCPRFRKGLLLPGLGRLWARRFRDSALSILSAIR